jgi:type III secretion system FlhB-like substrate exporter
VLPTFAVVVAEDFHAGIEAAIGFGALASPDPSVLAPRQVVLAVLSTALPVVVLVAVVAGTSTLLETRFGFAPARVLGGGPGGPLGRPIVGPFVRGLSSAFFGLAVAVFALRASATNVAHVVAMSPHGVLARIAGAATLPLRLWVLLSFVAALASTAVAVRAHRQRLLMTPRQIEDERKQGEGDPELRAARKRVAETVFSEVPLGGLPQGATACIVGPDVTVVVSWAKDTDAAPRLLRKLRGLDAERLTREASSEGFPVTHDERLASELHRTVGVGELLPEAFYDAVATVLAAPT